MRIVISNRIANAKSNRVISFNRKSNLKSDFPLGTYACHACRQYYDIETHSQGNGVPQVLAVWD